MVSLRLGGRAGGAKHTIIDFLVKMAVGFGIGAVSDFVVEVTRAPVLNAQGTFGVHGLSNFELGIYGISTLGVTAGVADIGMGGGKVLGFSRSGIPFFTGLAIGTYFYEHTLANLFGLRGLNPYAIAERALPPILPAGTPRIPGGNPLPGYGE